MVTSSRCWKGLPHVISPGLGAASAPQGRGRWYSVYGKVCGDPEHVCGSWKAGIQIPPC